MEVHNTSPVVKRVAFNPERGISFRKPDNRSSNHTSIITLISGAETSRNDMKSCLFTMF